MTQEVAETCGMLMEQDAVGGLCYCLVTRALCPLMQVGSVTLLAVHALGDGLWALNITFKVIYQSYVIDTQNLTEEIDKE